MAEKGTEDENGPQLNDLLHCAGDRVMFIKAANAGLPALLWMENSGLFFRCEVTDNCIFTKKLLNVSSGGVKLTDDSCSGKSLSCRYEKGHFNAALVETLAEGLENCQGPLAGPLRAGLKAVIKQESIGKRFPYLPSGKEGRHVAAVIEKAVLLSPGLLNKKIIIAEQDSWLTWGYDYFFRAAGFNNISFSPEECEETLKMALELQAGLVIARMFMPTRAGGVEFCRRLRGHPETRHCKIIMCTGCQLAECQEALDCGVSAYLPKPFEIIRIPALAAEVLCGSRYDYPPAE
ncbi:MAG: response regulator [Elusimicrobiota bacterium]|nr:response regulator [Elusimicrobiota bacterium]